MRKRFITDDDGHWYCIPADETKDFYKWVKYMESEDTREYTGKFYDDYRTNHPINYTFEKLERN
jgi:hypothetical protein